jgi:hypothetical protein
MIFGFLEDGLEVATSHSTGDGPSAATPVDHRLDTEEYLDTLRKLKVDKKKKKRKKRKQGKDKIREIERSKTFE